MDSLAIVFLYVLSDTHRVSFPTQYSGNHTDTLDLLITFTDSSPNPKVPLITILFYASVEKRYRGHSVFVSWSVRL